MEWEWLIQHFQCSNNGAGFHEEKTGIKLTLYPQQWRTKIWFHEDIAGCCWLEMISGVRGLQLHSTSLLWDLTKVQLPKPGLSSKPLLGQALKQMFWSLYIYLLSCQKPWQWFFIILTLKFRFESSVTWDSGERVTAASGKMFCLRDSWIVFVSLWRSGVVTRHMTSRQERSSNLVPQID